jgi:predicted double-glycine peptidase
MNLFRIVPQRSDWDCGVACLAMLLNIDYETALAQSGRTAQVERGLWFSEMIAIAEAFDEELVIRRRGRYNIQTATGIVHVYHYTAKHSTSHVVFLHRGLFYETDGLVWDAKTYLAHEKLRAGSILRKA